MPSATTALFPSVTLLQPPWPLAAPMTPKPAPARVAPSLQVSSQVILKVTPQALCLLSPPFPCSASPCSTYVPAMWYLLFWMASYSSMNSMRVDTLPFHLFLCPGSEHDAKVGTQYVFVEWILDDGILSESSTLQLRIVVCVCLNELHSFNIFKELPAEQSGTARHRRSVSSYTQRTPTRGKGNTGKRLSFLQVKTCWIRDYFHTS